LLGRTASELGEIDREVRWAARCARHVQGVQRGAIPDHGTCVPEGGHCGKIFADRLSGDWRISIFVARPSIRELLLPRYVRFR